MKRFISFLLVFIMLISNSLSFAAPGDFINTGLEKYYDVQNPSGRKDLIDDLKNANSENKKKFYREADGGKYINVYDEEAEQDRLLTEFLNKQGIDPKDSVAVTKFFQDPESLKTNSGVIIEFQKSLIDATKNAGKSFGDIKDTDGKDISEYPGNSSYAPKLIFETNYSNPVPGSIAGTTKFDKLNSFNSSSKWIYNVSQNSPKLPKSDEVVEGTKYNVNDNININELDKYIILYATDLNNRVKGYASVTLEKEMILQPRVPATNITDTDADKVEISPGNTIANAININGIQDEGWKYIIRTEPKDIFINDKFENESLKNFEKDTDIPVVNDSTIIDENFKRFIYLINIDEVTGEIKEYIIKKITKKDLSSLPKKLDTTNYEGPVYGSGDYTTKFSKLNSYDNWMYKTGKNLSIPVSGALLEGDFIEYAIDTDIEALVGDSLILAAVDNKNIKAFEIFTLNESNLSGENPVDLNIEVSKGEKPGTSMAKLLGDSELPSGATKSMYSLGKELPKPYLGRPYKDSQNYTLGTDIDAKDGQTLYIFATDADGKVLASKEKVLDNTMIKASLADDMALDKGLYLKDPVKGTSVGTIKFAFLNGNFKFKFKTDKNTIPIPEKNRLSDWDDITVNNSKVDNLLVNISDSELRADNGFDYNMMIVAVDESNMVQSYYSLKLNKNNVRLPKAGELNTSPFTNYSNPIKGDAQNSTKIKTLDSAGLAKVSSFKYDLIEDGDIVIDYNTIIPSAKILTANRDIQGKAGQYLLILAVDSANRIKYYDTVLLKGGKDGNIMSSNAPLLVKGTHFSEPMPGNKEPNSTKVPILNTPQGVTEWRYKISDIRIDFVEVNVPLEGIDPPKIFSSDTDIEPVKPGQYLLILGIDKNGNVLYQYNHRLVDANIRGGISGELSQGLNYIINKGSKAGTTQFTLLDGIGLVNSTSTRWKYKLVESVPTESKDEPYLGGTVSGASNFFNINTNIIVTPYDDESYGFLLLLATDGSGKTKGYKYIELTGGNVKEHAPIIKDVTLVPGTAIDTTKVNDLKGENFYKYIITPKAFDTPSKGDFLPVNYKDYTIGGDIKVKFGEHLTIFELDESGKIGGFKSFEIKADAIPPIINQCKATLKLLGDPSADNTLFEGSINNGGKRLSISLTNAVQTDAKWIEGLDKDPNLRRLLYQGLVANNQQAEWSKVVNALISDGFGNIEISGDTLTITLINAPAFDITDEQEITMIVHPDLIKGASNPIYTDGLILLKPTIKAKLSGSLLEGLVRANDLKIGGRTLVINLIDGSWKGAIDKGLLVGGLRSSGTNWNKVLTKLSSEDIKRYSSTEVIITLPPINDFEWDGIKSETITVYIDPDLLLNDTMDVEASPTFNLYPNILQVRGKAIVDEEYTGEVFMKAPDGREIHDNKNLWRIKVDIGNLKSDLSSQDLLISGLPKGLVATATKNNHKNIIDIVVSGTSSTKITDSTVFISVKGSAVTEPNSTTSDAIELKLKLAEAMEFDNVKYSINGNNLIFGGISNKMQYMDSLKGQWFDTLNLEGEDTAKTLTLSLEPRTVTIREKAQPKVIKVFKFTNDEAPTTGFYVSNYDYSQPGKVTITLNSTVADVLEYSKNGGGSYDDLSLGDNPGITMDPKDALIVRYKAVDGEGDIGKLPSKPTPKLNGEYLGYVTLAAGQGKILNTNTNMEYTLNSKNGTDGIWAPAKLNETLIAFDVGNRVWIRDKSDLQNFWELGDIKQAEKPNLNDVDYNIRLGMIYNNSGKNLEYKIGEGPWITLKSTSESGISFKSGTLEFRVKAFGELLASQPVKKEPTIQTMKSMPVIEIDDVKDKVLSINKVSRPDMGTEDSWDSFEYRINPTVVTPWKNGRELKDDDLTGDKTVEIRIRADKYILPSETNKTVKFTKNLDMSQVVLTDYTNPPTLNGTTTLMEYKIIYLDGKVVEWNKCFKDNTPLNGVTQIDNIAQIILRDGRLGQRDNEKIILNKADSAPEGVDIEKYTYINEKLNVSLNNVTNNMEYTIDNGSNWTVITGNGEIVQLLPISTLRVRLKETPDKLASISTPMLNGIHLGVVNLKNGSLIGTNQSMEYSLDKGINWTLASESETPIQLTEGNNIWIRQLNNHINIRKMGTVKVNLSPDLNRLKEVSYSIKNGRITGAKGLDYRINGSPWISITENSLNQVNFVPGKLEFRTSAEGLNLASEGSTKATILNPVNGPNVRIVSTGNKTIEYYDNSEWKKIDNTFEYKVGSNGNWKPASDFAGDDTKDGNVIIFVRKASTNATLPSNEKSANTAFQGIKANIASKVIENTTESIEYSINSNNGIDGSWKTAAKNQTSIDFVEKMNVWIREKGNPDNYIKFISDLKRAETIPKDDDENGLDFNVSTGTITNHSSSNLEFRIKKGEWEKLDASSTRNFEFTDGDLDFRTAATMDHLESLPQKKSVILSALSAPVIIHDDISNKIIYIDGKNSGDEWKHYQYRINGSGNWTQGELLLTDIDFSGEKTVYIRKKAEKRTLASQNAEVKFTKNLELSHVTLSTNIKPYELNGTTEDMEYMVILENDVAGVEWPFENRWILASNINTKLHGSLVLGSSGNRIKRIELRQKNKPETKVIIFPKP